MQQIVKQQTLCFQTKSGSEGSGWFGQELVRAVAESGTLVIYVAPNAAPAWREPKSENIERVFVPREMHHSKSRIIRIMSSLRRVLTGYYGCIHARRKTSDFLFSVPDPLLFFLPLQILLRLSGARVYLVVHDVLPHAWTLPEALRFLQKWCIGLSYRLATVLMPTTRGAKAELMDVFGIASERIEIVPHGAYLIEKTAPPNDLKSLLVFGTLRRNKGVLEAIQAVQKCRREGIQCTLKLAGSPDKLDNGYWASCEQQISKAPEGISTEIGFVPDERIPDLIAQSDAVLLPYRDFTSQSGVAVLMISGLRPVIASSVGGIKDLFDIGMVGMPLSERPHVDELAEAIKTFFQTSSHIWYQRCVDAREHVNSNIGWQAIGRRYSEIIFQRNQR